MFEKREVREIEQIDYEISGDEIIGPKKEEPIRTEKMLWAFEKDEKAETVTITPMNDPKIIIHGKQEAETFCNLLNQCLR